ncbi:MAG: transcription-repair coupling factor [Clostridiales bacterium]|nr:transcription-repair coupling factor [Clostridiales bacterium]
MNTFLKPLEEIEDYGKIKKALAQPEAVVKISGCIDSQKCHLVYGTGYEKDYRVIIASNDRKAREIYEDYQVFDKAVYLYPAKDIIFYSADIHGNAIVQERIKIIKQLLEQKPATIITTIDSGMDRVLPLAFLKESVITLKTADVVNMDGLSRRLGSMGYERVGQVEAPGQYAIRGNLFDVYTLTEENPYRIDFWDDEIDTIRAFDVESQRSVENVEEITIYPAAEFVMDEKTLLAGIKKIEKEQKAYTEILKKEQKYEESSRINKLAEEWKEKLKNYSTGVGVESLIDYFYTDTVSFFDYFKPENTVFYLDEPNMVREHGNAVEYEFRESMISRSEKGYILPGQMKAVYSMEEIFARIKRQKLVLLCTLDNKTEGLEPTLTASVPAQSVMSYQNDFEMLARDIGNWKKKGYRILLLSPSRTRAKRLADNLSEYGIPAFFSEEKSRILKAGEVMATVGNIHRGFEYTSCGFVVISESDIFGEKKIRKKKKKTYEGSHVNSFTELSIGDYVVHENHGIGIYRGIEKIEVDKVTKDYVKIEYAAGGVLYVLATELDALQKYGSSEGKKPKLNKLNSIEWKKTKTRVKGAVKEIAEELVELYAKRQAKEGHSFGPDTVWQTEFEELFPYEETEDQLAAIAATKKDMESKKIMDRLICGDVGYGKTEIAIRAAFKAVSDGKQVVFLVPTTILAQQHYNTFQSRMKDFPISVDMLSRFRTPSEQKKAIERLKNGQLDIIIGTHRVLSKDVQFKDLGLLIVDEEQRFGVTHKEKIKQLKADVDVLTLSATPIPRTLHMSLVGIRDMSVLEEPPVDRMPIQTFVMEENDEMVREAVNRELARNGQVYYVHNFVNTIADKAAKIQAMVPDAVVAFAHGQMHERELEKIMYDFINGDIDVLVSTTIIETGLDISNVNTIIVDNADRMGLSQLYQLRGRVGRSNRNAYAFLMYRKDKMLKEVAEKRLQAIREFTELGSGFKIAMRDLEIRGAGNLLGAKQHGHMEAVGYDLYCKMLNDAVKKMKGEEVEEEEYETSVEMDVDAFIPATYIRSEFQKLEIYKRIADIKTKEEYLDMQEELVDRFGEMPVSVSNLLWISYLKSLAHRVYLTRIRQKEDLFVLELYPKARYDINRIPELLSQYKGELAFSAKEKPVFTYIPLKKNRKGKKEREELFEHLIQLMKDFNMLVDKKGKENEKTQ